MISWVTWLSDASDLVGNLGIDYLKLSRWFLGNLRATVQKFPNLSVHYCFPSAKTKPYVQSTVNVYQHDGSDLSVSSWKPLGHRSMSLSRYKAGERAAHDPWGAARPCGSGPCFSLEAEAKVCWSGSHNLLLFPEALQTQTVELEFGKLGFFPLEREPGCQIQ